MVMDKRERKMSSEDVQGLLHLRRRGYWLKNKKGKASYDRKKFNKIPEEQDDEGLSTG